MSIATLQPWWPLALDVHRLRSGRPLTKPASQDRSWTKGEPVSRTLLDLAAGHGVQTDLAVGSGIIELAQRHGLIGALATQSPDVFVRAVWARELARKTVMEQHLVRLLSKLDKSGIRVALLKGPGVAESYRNPRLRSFSDLDLLVSPSQLDDALKIIGADGAAVEVPAKRPAQTNGTFSSRTAAEFASTSTCTGTGVVYWMRSRSLSETDLTQHGSSGNTRRDRGDSRWVGWHRMVRG